MKNRNALIYLACLVLCFFSSVSHSQIFSSKADASAACTAFVRAISPSGVCSDNPSISAFGAESGNTYSQNTPLSGVPFAGSYSITGTGSRCVTNPKTPVLNPTTGEVRYYTGFDQCKPRFFRYAECPENTTFDESSGQCKPPEPSCDDLKGSSYPGTFNHSPPDYACRVDKNCEVSCKNCISVSGDRIGCVCRYTGLTCSDGDDDDGGDPDGDDDSSTPNPPDDGDGDDDNGDGDDDGDGSGQDDGDPSEGEEPGEGGNPNENCEIRNGKKYCWSKGKDCEIVDGVEYCYNRDPNNPGNGSDNSDGRDDGTGKKGIASGACDSEPQTDGDPQLVGIHRQIWLSMCHGKEIKASDVQQGLQGDGELTDSKDLDVLEKTDKSGDVANAVNSALAGMDSAGSGGNCPIQSITRNVLGHNFHADLSGICTAISIARAAILLSAYIFAAMILIRAITGEGYN